MCQTEARRIVAICVLFLFTLIPPAIAETHTGKIDWIFSPDLNRDCFFFTLAGVTQADAARPNDPWFAVPRAHPGFKEIVEIVMAAHTSSRSIIVQTTGATACGLSGVSFVTAQRLADPQPFQAVLHFNESLTVPPGHRLIIEFLAVYGDSSAAGSFRPELDIDHTPYPIAVTTTTLNGGNAYAASQPARIYAEPGAQVRFTGFIAGAPGPNCRVTISGVLVDAQ